MTHECSPGIKDKSIGSNKRCHFSELVSGIWKRVEVGLKNLYIKEKMYYSVTTFFNQNFPDYFLSNCVFCQAHIIAVTTQTTKPTHLTQSSQSGHPSDGCYFPPQGLFYTFRVQYSKIERSHQNSRVLVRRRNLAIMIISMWWLWSYCPVAHLKKASQFAETA